MFKAEKKAGWYYGSLNDLTFLHPCTSCQQNTLLLEKYCNGELQLDSAYVKLLESSVLGVPPFIRNKREKVKQKKKVSEITDSSRTTVKRIRNDVDNRTPESE